MGNSRELREKHVCAARRVVLKVGTNVLTSPDGTLDEERVAAIAEQICWLAESGRLVVLVSSGAIGAGMNELGMKARPRTLPLLQAAASVGQAKLMARYEESFRKHNYHAAQMLMTRDDFDSRRRYLNACNTVNSLFELSCIPIINENDSTNTDEIQFGDNDYLAALVTHMARAELLIILTSVPGVYARRPSGGGAPTVLDVVGTIDKDIRELVYAEKTPNGVGGMETKLEAARIAVDAGEAALIADGREPDVIKHIMAGEQVGTLFVPSAGRLSSYKRWIRFTSRPRGSVVVDAGAREALQRRGKSLLPSGVVEVKGEFAAGDPVRLVDSDGVEFARGLTNYSHEEIRQIKGLQTDQIESSLGYKYYDEVIHRDNIALLN